MGHGGEGFMSAAHVTRIVAHAAVGCVMSGVQGGGCGSGAASAGFAAFAGPIFEPMGFAGGLAASIVAGGVGARLTGGKFANGAFTGAFGYLLNRVGGRKQSGYEIERVRGAASGGNPEFKDASIIWKAGKEVMRMDANFASENNTPSMECPDNVCGRIADGNYDAISRSGSTDAWYRGKPLLYINDGGRVNSDRPNNFDGSNKPPRDHMMYVTIHGDDSKSLGCIRANLSGQPWLNFMKQFPFGTNTPLRISTPPKHPN